MPVANRSLLPRAALLCSLCMLVLFPMRAGAVWSLDPARSHLAFISIKADHIGEVHTFTEMAGKINEDGGIQVSLLLDSVETLIPIRNERMREFLFKTSDYKEATLTAKVDPALISGMQTGDITDLVAEGVLSLHGAEQSMVLTMQSAKVADDTVTVASTKPLIIDAAKFGMTDGVEKLREIAGLKSISNAVPVTFVMTFVDVAGP